MVKKATTTKVKAACRKLLWGESKDTFALSAILLAIKRNMDDRKGTHVDWTDIPGWKRFSEEKGFAVEFSINNEPHDFLELLGSMQDELKAAVLYEARCAAVEIIHHYRTKIGTYKADLIIKELQQGSAVEISAGVAAESGGFTDDIANAK